MTSAKKEWPKCLCGASKRTTAYYECERPDCPGTSPEEEKAADELSGRAEAVRLTDEWVADMQEAGEEGRRSNDGLA